MRVLVVEDEKRLQSYVRRGLRNAGYAVDVADDGEEGQWLAESNDYDVMVLDLMLPRVDGLTVLRNLRSQGKKNHILILTARDSIDDRVAGLQQGADDYLVKPFDLLELLARVQALARRSYGEKKPSLKIGSLTIDTASRTVSSRGQEVDLRPREYALLEYLALRNGELVSRTEIEEHIYDDQVDAMSNVVDSSICILRKKLVQAGEPSMIQTRRGMGYILQDPGSG